MTDQPPLIKHPSSRILVIAETIGATLCVAIIIAALVGIAMVDNQASAAKAVSDTLGWTVVPINARAGNYDSVYSLAIDRQSQVWAATKNGLKVIKPDGQVTPYKHSNSELTGDLVTRIVVDAHDNGWLGVYDFGLNKLAPDDTWTNYPIPRPDDLSSNSGMQVGAIAVDAQGRPWAGIVQGLQVLEPDGSWTSYTVENSDLCADYVTALAFDGQGRLWVGTGDGLCMLTTDGQWKTYQVPGLNADSRRVNAIATDTTDRMWVATDSGLIVLEPDDITNLTKGTSHYEGEVTAIAIDSQGRVWAGSSNGEVRVFSSESNWTTYLPGTVGLPDTLSSIVVDEQGHAWIGHADGLGIFDINAVAAVPTPVPAEVFNTLRQILYGTVAVFGLILIVLAVADLTPHKYIRQFVIGLFGISILNVTLSTFHTKVLEPIFPCSGFGGCFVAAFSLIGIFAAMNIVIMIFFAFKRQWVSVIGMVLASIAGLAYWVSLYGWHL